MKGKAKKAYWEKQRVINALKREEEREANTQRKFKKPKEFKPLQPRQSKFVMTEGMLKTARAPSANVRVAVQTLSVPTMRMSEEEQARREAAARQETERKKKQVAPLFNKGGYQYIGDAPPEIIATLGRKI